MQAITVSKFRSNMKQYMDHVEESNDTIVIPRSGKAREGVVLMSLGDYNSLMETIHLRSSPANHQRLLEGMHQVQARATVVKTLAELEAAG